MTLNLDVRAADAPRSWDAFINRRDIFPRFSIALDGFVSGGPRFEPTWPFANFNHHEEVDRLATRATCAQVLMSLRQGLFKTYREDNEPKAHVFVNDCDEDVCLSWYLIKNHAVCEQAMNPLLNRLVMMEDALDATAGAYPFPPDLPVLREMAWIFEPYRQFRLSGQLSKRDSREYRRVIEDVEGRIGRHVTGNGDAIALDTNFKLLGTSGSWALVEETGAQARTGMFSRGITAFVSVRETLIARPDTKRYDYVVGRMSPFIPFDCERIYAACNALEGTTKDADKWGGSNTIGGSPRVKGSKIDPDTLAKVIEQIVSP